MPTTSGFEKEDVQFSAVVTLDDQLNLTELLMGQPAARRQRLFFTVLSLALFPMFGVFIAIVTLLSHDGRELGLESVAAIAVADPWTCLGLPWLTTAIAIGIAQIASRLLRRSTLRARIGAQLKQRFGVDASDPRLSEHVRCRFDGSGYVVETAGYRHDIPWRAIRAVRETSDILIVQTGFQTGYVLPKRDIAPDDLRAILALSARQSSPPAGPWGQVQQAS